MSENNGGPAFPQNDLSNYNMGPEGIGNGIGMSLRDWFAGQALPAIIAKGGSLEDTAWAAYAIADAMLKARE